jgi:hypothetical protein
MDFLNIILFSIFPPPDNFVVDIVDINITYFFYLYQILKEYQYNLHNVLSNRHNNYQFIFVIYIIFIKSTNYLSKAK